MASSSAYALVVGSGFAGSILSWILQRQGRQVILVDRGCHPRFAIGESSTPTADFLLAYLSQRWSLPELYPLAAYGTWQSYYPDLRCGLKRGFSYFGHRADQMFVDDDANSRSLLVAASATNEWSDTHWYRQDVDAFLAQRAVSDGVTLHEGASLRTAEWDRVTKRWSIEIESVKSPALLETYEVEWLIDASGAGNASAKWCDHQQDDDWMRTRSSALFGHFDAVESFSRQQPNFDHEVSEYFDSDNAAQHHVIEDGWYWMLRFQSGRTSVGLVQPKSGYYTNQHDINAQWQAYLDRYPSIKSMMKPARLTDPRDREGTLNLAYMPRMSRCRSRAIGPGWILLPVAYGFVDPLHSSGIAHALSGVMRVADILLRNAGPSADEMQKYSDDLRTEVKWIDTLVSGCYEGLPNFQCFSSFTAFYFAATIAFENQLAKDPEHWPLGYLNAADYALQSAAETCWEQASKSRDNSSSMAYVQQVRRAIEPWNTVGLLSREKKNRLNHTAPPKPIRLGVQHKLL